MSGNNQKVGVLSDFQPQTDVYTEILVSSQKAKIYKCFLSKVPFKRNMFWPQLPPLSQLVSKSIQGALSLLFIYIPFLDSQQIKLKLSLNKVKDPYKSSIKGGGHIIESGSKQNT